MKSQFRSFFIGLVFSSGPVFAQEKAESHQSSGEVKVLSFQKSGKASLGTGLAEIEIPKGYKFLDAAQSQYVLTVLWGNPPSTTYGMLFPEYANDTVPSSWAIEMSYSDEGHVDDEDAEDIDYEELLSSMQESAKEEGVERKKQGYPAYSLLGWASPPFYDSESKKLHWAKRLKFETDSIETLNYNIRILGKEGVLVVNAIGTPYDLPEINQDLKSILSSINFTEGNAYSDYQEGIDKKASYGIAGLIAGGVLMKTGILAKLGIFLLKFSKLIIVGVIAAISGLWNWIKGRRRRKLQKLESEEPNEGGSDTPSKTAPEGGIGIPEV